MINDDRQETLMPNNKRIAIIRNMELMMNVLLTVARSTLDIDESPTLAGCRAFIAAE